MCEKIAFEKVYSINVSDKTEKKGNLTYLSWAWAWAEFKKIYPDATYKVEPFDGTFCSGNEKRGYMVRTEVTADGLTYEMWLPVMDGRNQTILQPKMTEINKTIMRCLTKNLAMFGLGLYIYAGEDLPESEDTGGGKYHCVICGKGIDEKLFKYSMKKHGASLCGAECLAEYKSIQDDEEVEYE